MTYDDRISIDMDRDWFGDYWDVDCNLGNYRRWTETASGQIMYKIVVSDILEWNTDERFHACLCDPPYHLTSIVNRFGKDDSAPAKYGTDGVFSRSSGGFMGQTWDGGDVAFKPETWAKISEFLYPGSYLLAFGGTRTFHRLACAIEDAGFIIYDTIAWVYGSGFPKSHNISKAIDKIEGAEREVIDSYEREGRSSGIMGKKVRITRDITIPATEMAEVWDGYGTALKPAFEPIILARKPIEGSIAKNCVKYGSGGLNIDGCRVEGESVPINKLEEWSGFGEKVKPDYIQEMNDKGRWPANFIHDGSEEVLNLFPENNGSEARFFYCAKVSKEERDEGLQGEKTNIPYAEYRENFAETDSYVSKYPDGSPRPMNKPINNHPTLKPISLTEYLAKLILPPIAYAPRRILVPFSGAGSEMIGAHRAGWEEITGIEREEKYAEIAEARLKYWVKIPIQRSMFDDSSY